MEDLLPPNNPPAPSPVPARQPSRIVCDCCGCSLALDGGVLKTSDRAKGYNTLQDRLDAALSELAGERAAGDQVRANLATVTAERDQLLDDMQSGATRQPFYKRELVR
jgi:hypothetical protein